MSFINKVLDMLPDFDFRNDEGNTVLHLAVKDNDEEMVINLLQKMKDSNKNIINAQNNEGNTAFHLALLNNNNLIAQILDKAGADKTIRNNKGEFVEDITEEEHMEIVNFDFNKSRCSNNNNQLIGILQTLSKLSNNKPVIVEADLDIDSDKFIIPNDESENDNQVFLEYVPQRKNNIMTDDYLDNLVLEYKKAKQNKRL